VPAPLTITVEAAIRSETLVRKDGGGWFVIQAAFKLKCHWPECSRLIEGVLSWWPSSLSNEIFPQRREGGVDLS